MEKPRSCPKCGATAVDSCQIEEKKQEECVRN